MATTYPPIFAPLPASSFAVTERKSDGDGLELQHPGWASPPSSGVPFEGSHGAGQLALFPRCGFHNRCSRRGFCVARLQAELRARRTGGHCRVRVFFAELACESGIDCTSRLRHSGPK